MAGRVPGWVFVALATTVSLAQDPYANAPPYVVAVDPGTVLVRAIVTTGQQIPLTGDEIDESFRFVGVPDGMGLHGRPGERGVLTLLVNHEFSAFAGTPFGRLPGGARVSELTVVHGDSVVNPVARVTSGRLAFDRVVDGETGLEIHTGSGISRLCSAHLADPRVGFDRPVLLHGEEATGGSTFDGRGGQAFATFDGAAHTFPRLGRAPWENVVAAPFTGSTTVVFGLEDGPTLGSQLYMYVGDKVTGSEDPIATNGLNTGSLHVFAGDDPGENSEASFVTKGRSVTGHWSEVDWRLTDAQLDGASFAAGAFAFTRIEDGAADPEFPGVFYFVTTGRPGTTNPFGRLYRLEFDPANPTGPADLTIVLDGSEGIVSPDNVDMNRHGEIAICEDPGSNVYPRDTSMWIYDVDDGTLRRVIEIDRISAWQHARDADPRNGGSPGGFGSWEISGVIDAEEWLGRGAWLVDVQAHTLGIWPFHETVQGGQVLQVVYRPLEGRSATPLPADR